MGGVLCAWLDDQVPPASDERILHVDLAVARRRDALTAATALVHGLVVTRNSAGFEPMAPQLLNPWNDASS